MKNANQTLYDLINVSTDASQAEIEKACLQLGEKCQPDKNPSDLRRALIFAQIEKAYETLLDPVRRAAYDAELLRQAVQEVPTPHIEINTPGNPEELYKAIVGPKNQGYYLHQFSRFDGNGKVGASWHWPAFLCGGVWAAYRKMYGWFFAFWGIAFLSKIFEKTGAPVLSAIVFVAPWIAFAIYANSLYYNNVKKKIAVARLAVKDEAKLLEYLRYKGGVHTWVIWVFGGLPVIGILAAIALPAYQDYTKRARPKSATDFLDAPVGKSAYVFEDGKPALGTAESNPFDKIDPKPGGLFDDLVPFPSVSVTLPDGSKYVGQYMDGNYNGLGTFTFPDGQNYVGGFKDGMFSGQGTYTWANGRKHVGEFRDNARNGQGTEYRADGTILQSGIWENGVFIRGR